MISKWAAFLNRKMRSKTMVDMSLHAFIDDGRRVAKEIWVDTIGT